MPYSIRHLLVFIVAVSALLAGCSVPGLPGQPTATPTPDFISQDAAESMEAKLERVRQTPPGEDIELTLTEREITSYIAVNMPQDSRIRDVQVQLQEERIRITGKTPVGPLTQDVIIVVRPTVENGDIALSVVEATLGTVSIPQELVETANDQIRRTLRANDQLGTVKRLDVGDGQLTIVATRR